MRKTIFAWLESLPKRPRIFVEPFAGGASVGLTVARNNLTRGVVLIERDADVAAVWQVALGRDWKRLSERIATFKVSRKAVEAELSGKKRDLVSTAFRCLLRNRMQRGGIIGPTAGLLRKGEKGRGLRSRWYPETLSARLEEIHELRHKIIFIRADALNVLPYLARKNTYVFFVDPPYAANGKGPGLRLYRHSQVDPKRLFRMLSKSKSPCFVTYHESAAIRRLGAKYGFDVRTISMHAASHRTRRELILSKLPNQERK